MTPTWEEWQPDCRACAWHDGTLAITARREANRERRARHEAWEAHRRVVEKWLAEFEGQLRALGLPS